MNDLSTYSKTLDTGDFALLQPEFGFLHYLQGEGYTKQAAAGIVGNLQQESSLNPGAPGGGLAQWIGSRWTALVAFAGQVGLSPHSAEGQFAFLTHEIDTSYPGLKAQLNAASTPGEAATIFSNVYERPGIPALPNRIAYANAAYNGS